MVNNKNTSPRALAVYNAIILAVITGLGSFLWHSSWIGAIIVCAVFFLLTYYLTLYTIRKFIFRKIKLIYKLIYDTKATKSEEVFDEYILPRKSLDEVSEEVERWTLQKREEIAGLQENEKFRREFLMNLAHELKTPVFAIQGYVDTLLDGALEDEKVNRKFLENTAKNVERLSILIKDLNEISEIEKGKIIIVPTLFVIQDLTKDVFDTLSLKAQKKQISFSIKKGCEAPLKVFADKEKMNQVLVNLLDNAIKYGKYKGQIIASFYNLDENMALIEISDDGIGIEETQLSRLFERFYRTDKMRDRKEGGTGIGLAIVKHIVEAHGQTINVRSKPNIGSTFGFTLALG